MRLLVRRQSQAFFNKRLSILFSSPFIKGLFIGILLLYLLGGVWRIPLHGDEPTTIHKSHDLYLLLHGDVSALAYTATPADPADQELRLLNGVISAYGVGTIAKLIGIPEEAIPAQWLWGADVSFNRSSGHMPSDQLLFAARLSSALMTMVSIALVFALAKRLVSLRAAYMAAALYTSMPAVLLNGRRSMYEGATLLSVTLILMAGWAVVYWLNQDQKQRNNQKRVLIAWVWFGVAAGIGMASKHNLIVTIMAVTLPLLLLSRHSVIQAVRNAVVAGLVAFAVFFVLNPAWWSAPLQMPSEVIRLRVKLASEQIGAYGGFTNGMDRVAALVTQPFTAPQYYEVQVGWPDWIADQIVSYEHSGLAGIAWGGVSIAVLVLIASVGLVRFVLLSLRQRRGQLDDVQGQSYERAVFLGLTFTLSLIGLWVITPLNWQRYYLPLSALWAIVIAAGLNSILNWLSESMVNNIIGNQQKFKKNQIR